MQPAKTITFQQSKEEWTNSKLQSMVLLIYYTCTYMALINAWKDLKTEPLFTSNFLNHLHFLHNFDDIRYFLCKTLFKFTIWNTEEIVSQFLKFISFGYDNLVFFIAENRLWIQFSTSWIPISIVNIDSPTCSQTFDKPLNFSKQFR
jgi:hypothetical protein